MLSAMPRNIRKLQALNLLAGFVLWYPIEKLFLLSIGVGPLGISVNAVEFIIILLLLDVPSGILADRWRRKHVLTIAFLCMLAGSAVGAVSHNLWQYLVATLGIGGFVALTQGTFQALMYDSLTHPHGASSVVVAQGTSVSWYGLTCVGRCSP